MSSGKKPGLAFHDVNRLLEREHGGASELRAEPRAGVQPLDLGQRQVLDEPVPLDAIARLHLGVAIGKQLAHVGRAFEHRVVRADQYAVFGHSEVLLDVLGALFDGKPVGGGRVLGRVRGGAAVSDDERAARRDGIMSGGAAVDLDDRKHDSCDTAQKGHTERSGEP